MNRYPKDFKLNEAIELSKESPFSDLHEECGVCGVIGTDEAAHLVYLGLTTLQHRGQESAGIVSFDGRTNRHVGMGLVADVFRKENLVTLNGNCAIGHVRYSTTGSSSIINAQPLLAGTPYGELAVAHNGNFTNAQEMRKKLEQSGSIFQTTTDTEVIMHLIAKSGEKNLIAAIRSALAKVEGAYSLLFAVKSKNKHGGEGTLIGVRDPLGFRPLVLGKLNKSWVFASETCAFDLLGASSVREVAPGEMVIIEKGKEPRSLPLTDRMPKKSAFCIFEFIYFARPDSKIYGHSVYEIRRELGRQLAREAPAQQVDCVIAVPDSSVVAAIGYAEESGLPFEVGFIRSHYVGRTFIEPSQHMRDFRVKMKYNPIKENLAGKSIVLIDDSIVRGTTSRKLVRMLLAAGVKEIHMRISSPPITGPCHYGIDTPNKDELIAAQKSINEIRKYLGVTTLRYMSMEGLLKSAKSGNYCTGCFSGNYPTRLPARKGAKGEIALKC